MANGQALTTGPDARLTLTTLGGASLAFALDGTPPVTLLGPGKPLALITYLAFSPRRSASREHLVGVLWADSEPDRAHHALRQTVWQIRHSVGDRVVVTRNGDLALGQEIATDRDAFLAAVEAGDHQCAVALYAGEFLPDFAAPGGAGFEQWADLERIRLRTAFLRCAESLARRHLSQGHVREAQRIARRARDADPLNESGWRLLLETLAAGNDWTQSAMEADALERLLQAEEREPEPATRAAIRRARQAPADADGGSRQALVAELVGREKEFATVLADWDDAKRGAARHVHVTGPAGLGKTRLLQDTIARLRAAGARACYARANPGERGIPFAAAAEVAAQLAALPGAAGVPGGIAAALVALNPSLSARYPAVTPERRGGDKLLHRTVALTELLAAVADEGPVAVLLDDLHWADAESRQVLAGLAARLASHRVLLVTAARPTAERIFETAPATLRLPPLDERQVALFVTSIAALPDEPWARDLAARLTWATGGSPLLLIESLQLALERDTLALAGDSWTCSDPAALAGTLGAGSALRRRLEELDPDARWLVLTLAAAGTPVATTTLARAADRPEEILLPALGALEERGLVSRAGQAWEPAHDELAALALEAVTPETLREVLGALGSALVAELPADPQIAKRAAPLLAAAGDTRGLAAVLRGWIAAARARGDHRAPAALASEILRERANAPHVRAAVAALPLRIRLGFDSTTRRAAAAAAVAVMVLLALGAWAASGAGIPPDAVVYVVTGGDAAKEVRRVELRAEGWRGGEPLPPGDDVGALPWQAAWPARWHEGTPVPSPSGRQWAGHFTVSDSGGQDLHMSGPDGALRRLTWSSGDDGTPAWAPDESALAFATARWNPLSHYDVAVLDLGTGAVRQLTRGDDSDYEPHWSPDGSRIAFVRRYHDGRPAAACWVAVDASRTACVPLRGPATGTGMLGWRDERRVVVQGDSAGVPVHRVVDLETGSVAPLDIPEAAAVSLDPTGAWVLIRGIVPGTPQAAWYVAPLDQLSRVRRLTERLGDAQAFWGWAPHESHWVETLRIEPPAGSVPSDGAHRLLAEGRDRHGHVVPLHTLAWRSSDTTIATIDSDGIVRPRRTGTVTIHASAGGWRSGSQRITIGPPGFTTLISERWGGGLETEWVAYGEPRPLVVSTSDGRHALWSRGDSSFASGVYSRRTFTAAGGLGAEMEVSLSLTALQWQIQALVLDASLDTAMLARWDHRTGSIPRRAATHQPACVMMFPSNEGLDGVKALQMSNSQMESRRPEAPADLRNGTPHRFRVQILPDGRCGFALDGKPLWVTRGALPLDRPIRIVLEGKSHGTRVLVGPLEVWRGVKGDVDWRLLEEGRGEKHAPGR